MARARRCLIIVLLSRLFSALPLGWALAIGRGFGFLWYWLLRVRLGVARDNIRRVFGSSRTPREQRRILRRSVAHWAMYGVESLRLPLLTPELARELVRYEGTENLERARARGKGVIIVTAHVGSFDLLACSGPLRGLPAHVIFKDISWKPAHDFWLEVRKASGLEVIAPRRSREDIRAALARNHLVAFTVDQHMARHRAIVCEFFGQLAATSPAPVRFAFETGAPVIPVHIERADDRGRHVATFEPELVLERPFGTLLEDVRHNTERLNRIIEGWIREVPEQWLWLHRRWKVHDQPQGWEVPEDLRARLVTPALSGEPR